MEPKTELVVIQGKNEYLFRQIRAIGNRRYCGIAEGNSRRVRTLYVQRHTFGSVLLIAAGIMIQALGWRKHSLVLFFCLWLDLAVKKKVQGLFCLRKWGILLQWKMMCLISNRSITCWKLKWRCSDQGENYCTKVRKKEWPF